MHLRKSDRTNEQLNILSFSQLGGHKQKEKTPCVETSGLFWSLTLFFFASENTAKTNFFPNISLGNIGPRRQPICKFIYREKDLEKSGIVPNASHTSCFKAYRCATEGFRLVIWADQREAFKLSDLSQLSRTQGHPAFFARSSLCVESSNLSFNLNMIKAFTSNHPQPRSIFWPFRPFSDRRRFKISLLFKRYLRLRSGWVEASQTRVRGFDSRRVLVLFYVFVLTSY